MTIEDFRHEAVRRAPKRGDLLQQGAAVGSFLDRSLKGLGLALDAAQARDGALFVFWRVRHACRLVVDYRADGLAFMHEVESFVDVFERQGVGDEGLEFDFAFHGVFDHAGQL